MKNNKYFIILFLCGLLVCVLYGVYCLYHAPVLPEDGSYLYDCRLVYQGQIPARDFQWVGPYYTWPYVFGLAQYLLGPSLLTGKISSLILVLLILVLIYVVTAKAGGPAAGVIAFLVATTNFVPLYNLLHINTYAWACVLFLAALWLLQERKYIWAALCLLLAMTVRESFAPFALLLPVYLIRHNPNDDGIRRAGWGILAAELLILAYLLRTFDRQFVKMFFLSGFGQVNQQVLSPEFIGRSAASFMAYKFEVVYAILFVYFVPALVVILICLLWRWLGGTGEYSRNKEFQWFLWAGVVGVALLQLLPTPTYAEHNCILMPFLAILAGLYAAEIYGNIKDAGTRRSFGFLFAGLLAVQGTVQFAVNAYLPGNQLKQIGEAGAYIAALVPPEEKILTWYMPVAIAANREVLPGTNRGYHSYLPNIATAEAERMHIVNTAMLEQMIRERKARLVFITDGTFQNRLLPVPMIRNSLLKTIGDNYRLERTIEDFAGQGKAYIYVTGPGRGGK